MPDFTTKYNTQCETIGDSGSSVYDANLNANISSYQVAHDRNVLTNIIVKTIVSGMDLALMIILLPFTVCQKIYENDHLMVMLRVILEVSLELVMWLVLAGVSILTSAALIFDDLYCGKSGSESYRRLVKNCGSCCSDDEDIIEHSICEREENCGSFSNGKNEWADETLNEELRNAENRDRWLAVTPWTCSKKKITENVTEKSYAKTQEIEDEGSVNFSFYKPLHLKQENLKKNH